MNRQTLLDLAGSFAIIAGVILLVALGADIGALTTGTIQPEDMLLAMPQLWLYAAANALIFAPLGALINHQERATREQWKTEDN